MKKLVWCCFTSFWGNPESSVSWVTNILDSGFHRGDEYSVIFSLPQGEPQDYRVVS